jgi:transketolase
MNRKITKLQKITKEVKINSFNMLNQKGGGHYGGSFSCAEILVNVFFSQIKFGDKFLLSKAHAGVIYYALLAKKKIISQKLLTTYGKENSKLGVHGEHHLLKQIDFSCGSLGHGLSYAAGVALSFLKTKAKKKIYVVIGDGECQEGSVWEAALFSSHHKLKNLVVILDFNKKQSSGTIKSILNLDPIEKKWKSFGWKTLRVNGHSHVELERAFKNTSQKLPTIIIADTIKGKGISFLEKKIDCHYDRLNFQQQQSAHRELIK